MKKRKKTAGAAKKITKNKVTALASPGQPTKYKHTYNRQALVLAEKGFTDKDVAEIFSVTEQTINNWKKKFPQFFESLKKGKDIADQKVVQSLYQRALGYSHPDTHISNHQGHITKTNIIKHYAPDTTACIFWLKNRDKENWRDVQERKHGITDALADLIREVSSSGSGIPIDEG